MILTFSLNRIETAYCLALAHLGTKYCYVREMETQPRKMLNFLTGRQRLIMITDPPLELHDICIPRITPLDQSQLPAR